MSLSRAGTAWDSRPVLAVALLMAIPLVWGLVAGRLGRWSITAPIAMVVAGAVLTIGAHPILAIDLDTSAVEHFVEVVLAVVLFVDATEVHGGMFGREPRLALRLLLVALPLSLVLAVVFGVFTFPDTSFWLLATMATIVMPTDLAPVVSLIRDERVPYRLRELLNVESGLNDGFVAPIFLFCVAAADAHGASGEHGPDVDALIGAIPALLVAIGVGALVGLGGGWVLRWSFQRSWTEASALRVAVVALPIVAYALAIAWHGNGFVAAFVAGAFFRRFAQELPHGALHFVEDTGSLLGLAVWFLFGQLLVLTLSDGTTWGIVVFAVLAVCLARPLPVFASLAGTTIRGPDRAFLGWVGPRGLASIAFGLLAYNDLQGPENELVGEVMVVTVALSVLVHGVTALPIAAWYGRRDAVAAAPEPPERAAEAGDATA